MFYKYYSKYKVLVVAGVSSEPESLVEMLVKNDGFTRFDISVNNIMFVSMLAVINFNTKRVKIIHHAVEQVSMLYNNSSVFNIQGCSYVIGHRKLYNMIKYGGGVFNDLG